MQRDGEDVLQQPVDALPHLDAGLLRLDVDVARPRLGGIAENEVDQPHDGRQVDILGERRRIDELILVLGRGLDFSSGILAHEHVVRRRGHVGGGVAVPHALEPRLGDDHRDRGLARPEPDVLKNAVVHRIGESQAEHLAVEAQRNDPALPPEIVRQQCEDALRNHRGLAVEVFEMQCRRDRRRDDGFTGQAEIGERPSQGHGLPRPGLGCAREAGGVNNTLAFEEVADESRFSHRGLRSCRSIARASRTLSNSRSIAVIRSMVIMLSA